MKPAPLPSESENLTSKIISLQDDDGCWNVLKKDHKYYSLFNYYVPNYKSTLWTLVLLADIKADRNIGAFKKPLDIISKYFYDNKHGIYSLGKSHFPIPCLNGNMLYLHAYFGTENEEVLSGVIRFFYEHQRFDDGDFKTPSQFPYFRNQSCYGKHTCYWGVVKLLKGLSFIPENRRSAEAKVLIQKCLDFILLHKVCFGSRNTSRFIRKGIERIAFPNMYHSDFLEVLWLLKREQVKSPDLRPALELLKSKEKTGSIWELESPVKNLIIPITKNRYGTVLVTERAREVLQFYS